MKQTSESKEFSFLNEHFRVTRFVGSEVIEIQKLMPNGFWGKTGMVYKRIYFGHTNPLQEALDFFKESKERGREEA